VAGIAGRVSGWLVGVVKTELAYFVWFPAAAAAASLLALSAAATFAMRHQPSASLKTVSRSLSALLTESRMF